MASHYLKQFIPFRNFRIQYASNLFSKGGPETLKSGSAPYLALLGNCVRPKDHKFLKFCASEWEQVFIVPGPYEMMSEKNMPYYEVLDSLYNACAKHPNISILNQTEVVTREGVRLLGLSGWGGDPDKQLTGKEMEASIYTTGNSPITDTDVERFSEEDIEWLSGELKHTREPTVILTHGLSNPYLLQRGLPEGAYSRLHLDIFPVGWVANYPNHTVKGWLSGATGSCNSGVFGATKQRMFMGVNSWKSTPDQKHPNPSYQPDRFFEIAFPGWKERLIPVMPNPFEHNHNRPQPVLTFLQ